ncbi:helix-turn-helix domain-containing protein [Paenibacillus agricola]|uniref:Helix-turn-helix domain-containing protein n=1 Tax=Paenibacillus agricola TaxID=2716264 RepID=A0ABX0J0T9_9BACL|nr:helix-turn-helix domain-containing protein [Paenibacillus agricola]NHN29080.1 helix-turn-helix domain-containing protein [Paenibacillus agricola]
MGHLLKAIIVDDDLPVLDFLTALIPWKECGFELVGAFDSPIAALQHVELEKPDLIVTDIGMPEMNGIELLRSVKSHYPSIRAVILSCHDDFHYAQQAVKLHLDEYILKESMKPQVIKDLLIRLAQDIRTEQTAKKENFRLKSGAEHSKALMKQGFIRSILQYPIMNVDTMNSQAAEFGIRLEQGLYLPVIGYINRYQEAVTRFISEDLLVFAVENIVEEVLKENNEGISFRYEGDRFFLLFPYAKFIHTYNEAQLEAILNRICRVIQKYIKVMVSFVIGEPTTHVFELKEHLQELLKSLGHRFFLPETSVIWLKDVLPYQAGIRELDYHFAQASDEFRQVIFEENLEQVPQVVRLWMERVRANRYHPELVKEWLLNILLEIQMKLKSLQQFQTTFSSEVLHHTLSQIHSIHHLEAWLIGFMTEKIMQVGHINSLSKRMEILACHSYVETNLHRKLSQEEMAAYLHLNPSYFSRLFKKETGETFIEYVTRIKMEAAKKWLNTSNKSVEEIAEMLGFDNKSYFLKVFKTYTGMGPNDYRMSSGVV